MRKIDKIILHCSATPASRSVTVQDIDCWHRQRGFDGIGYHYVIYLDGTVHQGRPLEKIGAHCAGQNANSIGICYIGGTDAKGNPLDTRTAEQRIALKKLVKELQEKYPETVVYGQNEFAAKACPCFDVKKEFRGV